MSDKHITPEDRTIPERECPICHEPLIQQDFERDLRFKKRITCGKKRCVNHYKSRQQSKRAAFDYHRVGWPHRARIGTSLPPGAFSQHNVRARDNLGRLPGMPATFVPQVASS